MKALWVENLVPLEVNLIPDSAIVSRGNPFFVPDDDCLWESVPVVGVVISRLGMNIAAKFANRYYENMIVVSHQRRARFNTPFEWLRDGALVAGEPFEPSAPKLDFAHSLDDCTTTISINADELKRLFDMAISAISRFVTLKSGDMILIGDKAMTPDFFRPVDLKVHHDTIISVNGAQTLKLKIR